MAIELPAANADEGAMARLFIAEVAAPKTGQKDESKAMGWMRRVLQNRLLHPRDFDAKGATRISQIIAAHDRSVQFKGFDTYPTLSAAVSKRLQDRLAIANNPRHPDQQQYLNFAKAAIKAATEDAPADPCPTGLYFWRTHNHAGPGGKATLWQTLEGNDFYTLPRGFFG